MVAVKKKEDEAAKPLYFSLLALLYLGRVPRPLGPPFGLLFLVEDECLIEPRSGSFSTGLALKTIGLMGGSSGGCGFFFVGCAGCVIANFSCLCDVFIG